MDEAVDSFLTWLSVEKGRAEKTLKAYAVDLSQFMTHLESCHGGVPDANAVTRADIASFMGYCFDAGCDNRTTARKITAVRGLFAFLYRRGEIDSNPARGVNNPRTGKRLPTFLADNAARSFIEIPAGSFREKRDRALFETFYSTGARVSELAGADLVNLDLDRGTLKVLGKRSKERYTFLVPDCIRHLREYLTERHRCFGDAEPALFVNMRGGRITPRGIFHIVQRRSRDAGLGGSITPHVFRHSFATAMLDGGADIRSVQEMLGHETISTTQVYTHTTRRRLSDIYRRFHPHARADGQDEGDS